MDPSLKEIGEKAAAEAERQAIRLALQATQGNKTAAARLLRVDYKTLDNIDINGVLIGKPGNAS